MNIHILWLNYSQSHSFWTVINIVIHFKLPDAFYRIFCQWTYLPRFCRQFLIKSMYKKILTFWMCDKEYPFHYLPLLCMCVYHYNSNKINFLGSCYFRVYFLALFSTCASEPEVAWCSIEVSSLFVCFVCCL